MCVACAHFEDQLTALGERWAHICQWTEDRWSQLHRVGAISDNSHSLQVWLDEQEIQLKSMEASPALEIGQIMDRMRRLQVIYFCNYSHIV